MASKSFYALPILLLSIAACNSPETKVENSTYSYTKGSFGYDLAFLQKYDSVIVLKKGDAQVIVSPKCQGKIFTSTADGLSGNSFGWINYTLFDGPLEEHINAYGGENRFLLGPEGGKFSLFFPKGAKMEFANWKTPAALDSEPWTTMEKNGTSVKLQKDMQLVNYAGTVMNLLVKRNITILEKAETENLLQVNLNTKIKWVGYRTENTITNTGNNEWNSTTGMPCIWMLDMFTPSDSTVVIIPYKEGNLPAANTDYFGKIPDERIRYKNNVLFFKVDSKQRGKLGIFPGRAKPVAGSYDWQHQILTITIFDVDPSGKYLNQEWRTDKDPFSGDAMNAYNDGPLADGKQLGPFYELASVSTAAFLQPGNSLTHFHSVFHFKGEENELNEIATKVFGVSVEEIKKVFN